MQREFGTETCKLKLPFPFVSTSHIATVKKEVGTKCIERFWTTNVTPPSSQDYFGNDKALLLWGKHDF